MAQPEHSIVNDIGRLLTDRDLTLAVAESLTGGELSARIAAAKGSSDWYRGGLVAYSSVVKRELLDVPEGPVVSKAAVEAMAECVARVLDADVGIAVSGVAGPAPQDGRPPGTVWMAVHLDGRTATRCEHFDGEAHEIVDETLEQATEWLRDLLAVPS